MAITRKPSAKPTTAVDERAAAAFIEGAGAKATKSARTSPVMIRFDKALLARVDQAARRRGVSRSAWVQFTISRALDAGEG
jgi:hypothetical protein